MLRAGEERRVALCGFQAVASRALADVWTLASLAACTRTPSTADDEALARELDAQLNAGARRTRGGHPIAGQNDGGADVSEDAEWQDDGEDEDEVRWAGSWLMGAGGSGRSASRLRRQRSLALDANPHVPAATAAGRPHGRRLGLSVAGRWPRLLCAFLPLCHTCIHSSSRALLVVFSQCN